MPELPEVETIASRLRQVLPGKTVASATIMKEKSFIGDVKHLYNQEIISIGRRAKIITIQLANNYYLLIHLKMTGQLLYVDSQRRIGGGHPTADWVAALPNKHTRIVLTLSDKTNVFFNDQRIFGWIKLVSASDVSNEFSSYGPDINSVEASFSYFQKKAKARSVSIKQFLLDGSVLAGIGNIYACDALNLAQVSPFRSVNDLDTDELQRVLHASKSVIQRGIDTGGASIENYVGADGLSGTYQHHVLVYKREGQDCYNCGTTIRKEKIGGRGTYFCPNCQK